MTLTVCLPEYLGDRVRRDAEAQRRTKSNFLRILVERHYEEEKEQDIDSLGEEPIASPQDRRSTDAR
jgi:hypothetical protein